VRKQEIDAEHHCQMVDMTAISIHDKYDRFMEVLYQTEGFEEKANVSTAEYAIYFYPQSLIKKNSNLPFFVASPKLFSLMNDTSANAGFSKVGGSNVPVRIAEVNEKTIRLVKLGDIAEVVGGVKTYDNKSYVCSGDGIVDMRKSQMDSLWKGI
jgi:hypothetical protein